MKPTGTGKPNTLDGHPIKTPRPENHPSCLEVVGAENALAYLRLRKKKMGGTKNMDARFDKMILELEKIFNDNKLLHEELRLEKEVTDFYADSENWLTDKHNHFGCGHDGFIVGKDLWHSPSHAAIHVPAKGGKLARTRQAQRKEV